jgi:hypothetical protein
MAVQLSTTVRNAMLDAITTAAGNGCILRIYDNTSPGRPASPATAVTTQVVLAELTCGTPFAGTAASGVLTLSSITQDSSANNSGTATWFRIFKSDGTTAVADGNIALSASDLNMSPLSITSGQPVQVTSVTLTAGNA